MKLIAGLGNPGKEYALTRHNAGFVALDKIAETYKIPVNTKYKKSVIGAGKIVDNDVILMKPVTYMNLSGTVIRSALAKWRITPENLIVIYDDIDLPLGTVRIRKQGSSAGHKGVESIIFSLNNDKFIRIRIGINQPPAGLTAEEYVLSPFTNEELELLKPVIEKIPGIIETIIKFSVEKAMNEFNRRESITNN